MLNASEDAPWRKRAGELGAVLAKSNYTWDQAVSALVENLFD
jgi:hypothetical protein